jgi:hypothetical protein
VPAIKALLGLRPETYEETLTVFLIDHFKPGLTVIDVEAHVGADWPGARHRAVTRERAAVAIRILR